MSDEEVYISVDVETSGPIPGEYSMLSIGACGVDAPEEQFECLLKPMTDRADSAAMAVSGLSLDRVRRDGLDPADAMAKFRDWVIRTAGERRPVLVAFNAPFDWSFVNYYFHRFLGDNPFGFTALDIKAFYMGVAQTSWGETRSSRMRKKLGASSEGNHDALCDAVAQAELFRLARAMLGPRKS